MGRYKDKNRVSISGNGTIIKVESQLMGTENNISLSRNSRWLFFVSFLLEVVLSVLRYVYSNSACESGTRIKVNYVDLERHRKKDKHLIGIGNWYFVLNKTNLHRWCTG